MCGGRRLTENETEQSCLPRLSFVGFAGCKRGVPAVFSWDAGKKINMFFWLFIFFEFIAQIWFLILFFVLIDQTVAVIPVLPHGVVQFGSSMAVGSSSSLFSYC